MCSCAFATEFTIDSPEKGNVSVKSSLTNKALRWREKDKVLVAEVTFSDADYAGDGTPIDREEYDFTIPGVTYDPAQKLFFVQAPNGDKIAIAQQTKVFLGTRIDLCKTATIHIRRIKSGLSLALDINTKPPPETPVVETSDGTRPLSLDTLLRH